MEQHQSHEKKPRTIWINGELSDDPHHAISVYDHGLLYGDGVFAGIRAYDGRIFEAEAHLDRLYESARAIRLDVGYTRERLTTAMGRAMEANMLNDAYLRVVVTRGVGDLGLDPRRCASATVFVVADTINIYPPEYYETGMRVVTASVVKNHPNALPSRVKSLNYLNNILAKLEANDAGVPEAIMLNHAGHVAECTADNVFVVKDGHVRTPPPTAGILQGITRDVVMRLCGELGIPCRAEELHRHDLYVADECFLTGTAAEVMPVVGIDGRDIADGRPGPISRRLKDAYGACVRAHVAR